MKVVNRHIARKNIKSITSVAFQI